MPSHATPLYVRLLARLVRPFANFDFGLIKPLRCKATELLGLRPGDSVIDAGCGSGGAFPSLIQAVGRSGTVMGVEISPVSVAHARQRAAVNRWGNVEVVLATAHEVPLEGLYNGLLMFAVPDAYASRASLDRLARHLRPGARIVMFGSKRSKHRLGWRLKAPLDFAMRRLSLPATPGLDAEPWRTAASYFDQLVVEERFHGCMFIAAGSFRAVQQCTS